MFTIHQAHPSKISSTRVPDPAGTTLEMVARTGPYPGKAFVLAQGDVKFPFLIPTDESLFDETMGEE